MDLKRRHADGCVHRKRQGFEAASCAGHSDPGSDCSGWPGGRLRPTSFPVSRLSSDIALRHVPREEWWTPATWPVDPSTKLPSMSGAPDPDSLLIERIRSGDSDAWNDLISRYEGRLLAFVESRIGHRAASEDIVQEAFIGFLNSLPNYDGRRPLESYLFSICAYKLTDHLRREGRRPAVPLSAGPDSGGQWQLPGTDRAASSIARSGERKGLEERAVVEALREQVDPLAKARRLDQD